MNLWLKSTGRERTAVSGLGALARLVIAVLASAQVLAQGAAPTSSPARPAEVPPLPADAHVSQTIEHGGRTLTYTATVGTIPVFGADDKKSGDVVFTPPTRSTARIGR